MIAHPHSFPFANRLQSYESLGAEAAAFNDQGKRSKSPMVKVLAQFVSPMIFGSAKSYIRFQR